MEPRDRRRTQPPSHRRWWRTASRSGWAVADLRRGRPSSHRPRSWRLAPRAASRPAVSSRPPRASRPPRPVPAAPAPRSGWRDEGSRRQTWHVLAPAAEQSAPPPPPPAPRLRATNRRTGGCPATPTPHPPAGASAPPHITRPTDSSPPAARGL
jgi:hypothetical protein